MKTINLTQGQVAAVDDEDFALVNEFKWYAQRVRNSDKFYAVRNIKNSSGNWTKLYMHKFLTKYKKVDHVNGNGLDNKRSNLREATTKENNCNTQQYGNNTSGRIGVHWNQPSAKWIAQASCEGKRKYLGSFEDIDVAALTRDNYVYLHYGRFAVLNFPELFVEKSE